GEEHICAQQGFFEFCELGSWDVNIRGDAAATGYLAAAVGQLDLAWMLWNFALIVVFVKGNGLVVALDEATAGSVVTGGSQGQASVFTERRDRLHQTLAERGFAYD